MRNYRIGKAVLIVLVASALFLLSAICAWAVPARPGSGHEGSDAACRSHAGALITLDDIPARRSGARFAPSIQPAQKNIPLLTIVIGFSNVPYENEWNWHEAIFAGEKSLSAYYTDMSFGKFTFTPAAETAAFGVGGNTNTADRAYDGVVHVTLAQAHKNWIGDSEDLALANAMIASLEQTSAYVDFASFDADGDGKIAENELAIGFVFAGYEASATSAYSMGTEKYLWAHAWSISDLSDEHGYGLSVPTVDGTQVDAYIAIAEHLDVNDRNPISVFAHELGHYLGLPDLYDTSDYANGKWAQYDVSDLSVMAGGSWGYDPDDGGYIPYSMDIWSRCVLGWCEPIRADHDGTYCVCAQSYTAPQTFSAVYLPTQKAGEYYLLENRQFAKWDAGLDYEYGDGGVIIWHIDDAMLDFYLVDNQVNSTNHRPAVMPLYPEKKGGAYTFIGLSDEVCDSEPFFSSEVWNEMFGADTSLDLPLYGTGGGANRRDRRTLSGLKLQFPDESAQTMTVRLSTADHVHALSAVPAVQAGCEMPGVAAHWVCGYCGRLFSDEQGSEPTDASALTIPATGHSFSQYVFDHNATATADGTETAVCDNGCGKTDTRPAAGTRAADFASVTIDDRIELNLLLDLDARGKSVDDVSITLDGSPYAAEGIPYDGLYRFSVATAPARIAQTVVVTVGGETLPQVSVWSYCRELCGVTYDAYGKEQALARAILAYAQAASNVFGPHTSTKIDAHFAGMDRTSVHSADATFTDATGVVTGTSFMALTQPEFRFRTAGVDEQAALAYNASGVTASYADETITESLTARFVKTESGDILLEVTGVSAEHLQDTIVVTVADLGTITFNGVAFARAMAQSGDEAVCDLGAALYNYGAAAKTCFAGA